MVGKTILHYKILEKIGEGGMGVVYKAEDTKLERTVAIKFLPRQIAVNSEERERFKIEAKAAASLNHPNIATIHAIEEVDGDTFIVMEYIKGKELKELMIDDGELSIEDVTNCATQIAEGLKAAHKNGVTHRDIKSSNIMITDENQVKIMDFGLAKVRGGAQVTKVGTTLGTAAYMSPEQARGEEADHRSDIWSFGVLLYEMLTGKLPFGGDYEQAVMYSIMNEEPEPVSVLCSETPEGLQQVVDKSLEKNGDARYQSVQALLADLKTVRIAESPVGQTPKTVSKGFKPTPTKKWPILLVGFAVIALLTVVAIFMFNASKSDSTDTDIGKSIAVLPFTDMSPSKDQEYFGDGMAEAIINALVGIPGLKVSARTSAFQFKGGESDIPTIGEKLGVATVLEGSVAKSGNKLRITAQLINVADGFHLWSDTYDRELTDIFAIQDELSRSIVAALQVKLSGDGTKTPTKRKSTSVEAYTLYLRGRYFWNRRTEAGLNTSIGYFQQAIDYDPTYALAYAGLADAYNMLGAWQYLEPSEAYPKGRTAAQKALEIDETLAEAHASLANYKFRFDWDWAGAEADFGRAIELNPNYASAHHWYAVFLSVMGRHGEARTEIDKALELDPLSLIINGISGLIYQWAGKYDQAFKQHQKTVEIAPEFIPTRFFLFQLYLRKGMLDEAFTHFMGYYPAHYNLTTADKETLKTRYKNSGWSGVARFMINMLEVRSTEKYVSPTNLSVFYIMLKDHARALDYLEKAYQIRTAQMVVIGVLGVFDALHKEPRFQALLKKIGLPE